ncbi:aspartate/glutamate racemase family protein [Hoeflea ulvae]|uniref:Amino acid racemase n=1 Tax=Hoeflea ulvae TaxID=2983764 RepID=A0ABT3Y9R2_9HYPH|nr:amino acid racemase [Hoeflea ulvae]MCY0092620.1 amino acid racemase [Hoeflea ulvae]
MKLIGLLGGVGWKTTATYYRMLNERMQKEFGAPHTARVLLHSASSSAIISSREEGDRVRQAAVHAEAALSLKDGGADFIVIASNAIHEFADHIAKASGLDLLHIADATGAAIKRDGFRNVALLGTRATMEADFYQERLGKTYGVSVTTPDQAERAEVDRIIFEELGHGVMSSGSRMYLAGLISAMCKRGAEAVVLGCSELTSLVPTDSGMPHVYDTTRLHAASAVQRALGNKLHV